MKDELISRQAAINAIKCVIWDKHIAKDAIDVVCNVPSVQPEKKEIEIFRASQNDLDPPKHREISNLADLYKIYKEYGESPLILEFDDDTKSIYSIMIYDDYIE